MRPPRWPPPTSRAFGSLWTLGVASCPTGRAPGGRHAAAGGFWTNHRWSLAPGHGWPWLRWRYICSACDAFAGEPPGGDAYVLSRGSMAGMTRLRFASSPTAAGPRGRTAPCCWSRWSYRPTRVNGRPRSTWTGTCHGGGCRIFRRRSGLERSEVRAMMPCSWASSVERNPRVSSEDGVAPPCPCDHLDVEVEVLVVAKKNNRGPSWWPP